MTGTTTGRRIVALAVLGVVAGALAASRATAEPGPRKPDGGLPAAALAIGRILEEERRSLSRSSADGMSELEKAVLAQATPPEEPREDIIAELIETADPWPDLLSGGNLTWREKVQAVRDTDPETADAQSAAGRQPPNAADALYEGQLGATVRYRVSIQKSLEPVRKALAATGRPAAIVGELVQDPPHPRAGFDAGIPFFLPLALTWGDCDETVTVVMMDPAYGNEHGTDESFVQILDSEDRSPVAELRLHSGTDFAAEKPGVFQFEGIPPGDYFVVVGIVKDGARGLVQSECITVPAWDPDDPPPSASKSAARQAKKLGVGLRTFYRQAGTALLREVRTVEKEADRGQITDDEAWERFSESMRAAHGRFRGILQEHRDDWWSWYDVKYASDPEGAAREREAGTGSAADRIRADEQAAVDLGRSYLGKAAATFGRVSLDFGSPIAWVTSALGVVPHPVGDENGTATRTRSYFGGLSVLARCDGSVRVFVLDPRDGDEIDRVFVEIRENDTRTVVLRREMTDADVDEDWIGLIEADGLLQPGRTYDVRLVTGGDPPFAALDGAVITVPAWEDDEPPPPPPCSGTTFTATINGSPYTVPPLQEVRLQVFDGKFYGMSARWADTTNSSVTQFNFAVSPHELKALADVSDAEMVFTRPGPTEAISYFFVPAQLKVVSELSATYRVRELGSFVRGTGCATVEIDGFLSDWPNMGSNPFSLRLSLDPADATQ